MRPCASASRRPRLHLLGQLQRTFDVVPFDLQLHQDGIAAQQRVHRQRADHGVARERLALTFRDADGLMKDGDGLVGSTVGAQGPSQLEKGDGADPVEVFGRPDLVDRETR